VFLNTVVDSLVRWTKNYSRQAINANWKHKEQKMAEKQLLKRVKIDDKWYDVSEGWAGTLNLSWGSGSDIRKFTAKEPYAHMNDFYFVYDENENKVGEIDINNRSHTGQVSDFEITVISSSEDNTSTSRPQRRSFEKPDGVAGWIMYILVFSILPYLELFWSGFWTKYTAERKDWWRTLGCTILFAILSAIIVFGIAHSSGVTSSVIWTVLTLLPLVVLHSAVYVMLVSLGGWH
jgi:hypothetical protein